MDSVFSCTIRLCTHATALHSQEYFPSASSSKNNYPNNSDNGNGNGNNTNNNGSSSSSVMTDLLFAVSQQIICKLVRHSIHYYSINRHSLGVCKPGEWNNKIEKAWAKQAYEFIEFHYFSLFMRYFVYVCSFQFE